MHAALATLQEGSRRHRPSGRFLRQWALMHKRAGDLQQAAALFKRAAQEDPRDERTWLQVGCFFSFVFSLSSYSQ